MIATNFQAVLFDLDGTLLDTAPDLGAAANYVLGSIGKAPLSHEVIHKTASDGALGLIKAGLTEHEQQSFDLTPLRQALLDYYSENLYVGTKPYAGMTDLIAWMNQESVKWGIVTNKPAFLTEPLMAQVKELPGCSVIVSADTLPVRKPNPEPLWFACDQIGVKAADCLYIGDHIRDIQAGKNAGMITAIAQWGYISPEEKLTDWEADITLLSPLELLDFLRSRS